ncbi:protein translocase subunit SecF [Pseudoalteromonas sp. MT33b]|uniref:protein translocase subunit SecF n=1 Tax=Pseudoalteromonas sp. MT33b TaxID=2759705 RepID=UPI0015F8D0B6|nr:protein translocase subunit SecF [Pseudoalteromonas sp. MT33b]QMW15799.1 protein translocase subunit SecF [Pseudoalteromonas sp. MT33b]
MSWSTLTAASKARVLGLLLSCALVISSLGVLSVKGLNFGLDFTGGYITDISTESVTSIADLTAKLSPEVVDKLIISKAGDHHFVLRQAPDLNTTANWQAELSQQGIDFKVLSTSFLGSQVGDELFEQGCLALFAALIAIMVYLAVRFEWRLAVGSVVALLHDLILVLGLFSLLGLEFNLTVLASLLAIIGYSLNDSIIVGDRVRELLRIQSGSQRIDTHVVINDAIRSTLTRTLITSGTTLATIACIWLLAGAALTGFAIALFVGIVVGTFSSICIAATLPQLLGLSSDNYTQTLDDKTQAYIDMP